MQNGKPLKLDDARKLTPPVNPVEAMRQQLALAVYNEGGAKEKDITEMIAKLRQMALSGDLKAMQMFFKLTAGLGDKQAPPPPPPPVEDSKGLKMLAESLRDIVDEIRITKGANKRQTEPLLLNGHKDDHDD